MNVPYKNTKEKGDALENFIAHFCGAIENSKVQKRVYIIGKSGTRREIDVLIEGQQGPFAVKIVIQAKHYQAAIGIGVVESFIANIQDVAANIGVMICPAGFTKDAQKRAAEANIQLFEAFDPSLKNSRLVIPIRYIVPKILTYGLGFRARNAVPLEIVSIVENLRFHLDEKTLTADELLIRAWNEEKIPQEKGVHLVNFNTVATSDIFNPEKIQYCELLVRVEVGEDYYLALEPASFFKEVGGEVQHFDIKSRLFPSHEDRLKNGWKHFISMEELDAAADVKNQPPEVRRLAIKLNTEIVGTNLAAGK